jgi:molybdopterin molybdotransferase
MSLLPVDDAKARVLKGVKPLAAETVLLARALGRVLARDIRASRDQPPFASSAMDGYAVRFADVASAPATLSVIGMSAAGHAFTGRVKTGTAVRIFTGAPVPTGADTVIIQENTEGRDDLVTVLQPPRQGQNIRRRGLDFAKGDLIVGANTLLTARDIGLAAAANQANLSVRRRPRVAILATGDELVVPGRTARPDQVFASNGFALRGLVSRFGGEARDLGIVRDDLKATMRAIARARGFDILLTTGGASVGMHDLVQEALKRLGIELDFWKIAMRPGKPLMFARNGRQRVIGLPGNPVSALVCARLFVKPLVSAYLGLPTGDDLLTARLAGSLPQNDQRQDYIRSTLERTGDGSLVARPFSVQDSSMQRTFAQAQALIVRAPAAPAVEPGATISVLPLDF